MKRNVILLVDADPETCAATLTAAQTTGFDVRFGQIQRDLSEVAEFGLDEVALIILDYDSDGHEPAVTEAFAQWLPPRPLIFISSDGDAPRPRMLAGSAAKHLTKPATTEQIVHAIEAMVDGSNCDPNCNSMNCDRFGHPRSNRDHVWVNLAEEKPE